MPHKKCKMKKLLVLFVLGFLLYGCGCMAQIPPQYIYVDSACVGVIPDYSNLIVVTDNCEVAYITQTPAPGTTIAITTQIQMEAVDMIGNTSSVYFNALLLDTIAPLIQLNPAWTGYTDQEVGDMYKVYYGWVQGKGDEYNEKVAGKTDTIPFGDTIYTHTYDTMKIFYGTIPIFEYRIDEGYWANETPDLTAWFQ